MYNGTKAAIAGGVANLAFHTIDLLFGTSLGDEEDEKYGLFESIGDLVSSKPEEREEAAYKIVRELINFAVMIGTGSMGNIKKQVFNTAFEIANNKAGEGITRPEGVEYDKHKNGVLFANVSDQLIRGDIKEAKLTDVAFLAGAQSRFIKGTINLADALYTEVVTDGGMTDEQLDKILLKEIPLFLGAVTGAPVKDFTEISNQYLYGDKKEFSYNIKSLGKSGRESLKTNKESLKPSKAEMDAMTQEMTTEEIAAMEKEIAEGLGKSFDEIFGA